jgi:hypothetical protein
MQRRDFSASDALTGFCVFTCRIYCGEMFVDVGVAHLGTSFLRSRLIAAASRARRSASTLRELPGLADALRQAHLMIVMTPPRSLWSC